MGRRTVEEQDRHNALDLLAEIEGMKNHQKPPKEGFDERFEKGTRLEGNNAINRAIIKSLDKAFKWQGIWAIGLILLEKKKKCDEEKLMG